MSLVAWYKLDQNLLDTIGSNHGTMVGLNYTYELGRIDYAVKFTSNDTRINTPLSLLTEDGKPFSISFWCKKNTDWSQVAWCGERNSSYGWMLYRILTFDAGLFSFWVNYLNTSDVSTSQHSFLTFPSLGIWYHVVLSLNGANRKTYINGNLTSNSTITDLKSYRVEPTTKLGICSQGTSSSSYSMVDGSIDDFRIFDYELSLKEVKELYKSKVVHLKLDNHTKDNSYGLVGIDTDMQYSYDSKIGNACYDNSTYLLPRSTNLGIVPRITLDQTICMWLYPTDSTVRQNPYNKTYGGEGTITFEANRTLTYYWGTNGGNTSPYVGFGSSGNIPLNQWSHIAVTRNLSGDNMVRFYINGIQTNSVSSIYTQSAASTQGLIIGTGYTNTFRGKIDDVRVYATALTQDEIIDIMKNRAKLDNIGNFYTNQIKETKYKPLKVNYKQWVVGTQGSQGDFIQNGLTSENYIIEDIDPWGKTVPIWECRPTGDTGSGGDGGWNYTKTGIDPTKLYRFSVFVRRTVIGNGYIYLGCLGNVKRLDTSTIDGNPYFWYGNLTNTDWILIVGYILPYDTMYTTNNVYLDSGRWKVSDKSFIGNINYNFKWGDETITNFRHRAYLFYSTDASTRQQFVYPRVDLMDGTQPTLDDLLSGFDSYNWDYIKDIDTTKPLPLSISDKKTYISIPNELGPTNGMIAYWKFENNLNDLSGNKYNNGTLVDVNYVKGIDGNCVIFNGSTSTISMSDILNMGYEDRSYSCWFKSNQSSGSGLSQIIFSKSDNGTSPCRHFFGTTTTDKMYAWMSGNPNTNQYSTLTGATINVCDNSWHHVAVTYNRRGNLTLYLDGQIEGIPVDISIEKNTDMTISRPFRIGSYNNILDSPILLFNGLIDDFRVYNRVLIQEEVNIIYNLYKPTNQQKMILSKDGRVYVKQGFKEV